MSEFKFSCPNCQQNIQATSEYSGQQINCPSCQTLLVVPPSPDAPAAAPGAAPSGPRLSIAAATPHAQASAPAATPYTAKPTKKKKPQTGLIVGLSLGAVAIAAAIYFWPELMKKVSSSDKAATAAAEAATNAPPPPPPELTTEEIFTKVGETYKGLTDYAAKAQTISAIDMSAIAPGQKSLNMTTTSTLQLGRTNNFRLDWEQKGSGATLTGSAWNSGKGNFVGYGPYQPTKVKTREAALTPAAEKFFILSPGVAELFFSDTNSFADQATNFTKTNNPNLNAPDSYVLTGDANHVGMLVWVNKQSFLITQIEIFFGEPIDEAEIKKLPSAQRQQLTMLSKLKGTVTETYSSIQVNQHLMASAFESAYKPTGNPTARRAANQAGSRQNMPGSQAEMLTQPGSRRRRPQQ